MAHRPGGLAWSIVALSIAACVPAVSPDEARRDDEAAEGSPARVEPARPLERDGALELELDDGRAGSPVEVLSSAPGRTLAPSHAERVGWSADGQTFAYCRPAAPECTECRLLHHDGTTQALESGEGCGEGAVSAATLDARLAALALTPGATRWRAGAEVVLVVETRQAEQTNSGAPRAVLKLGARPREGGPPGWLVHVDPCEGCGTDQVCAAQAHFDAVALDPAGEELAVLVHALASDGSESLRVERVAAKRAVEAARTRASSSAP